MKSLPQGPTKNGIKLATPKQCGCCDRTHHFMPPETPFQSELYWWDCKCGSTLCAMEDMLYEKANS